MPTRSPSVLAIGGLDPSGNAGLLVDVAAVHQAGARAIAVATALTVQGRTAFAVQAVAPRLLERQLIWLRETARIRAVKIGMVPNGRVLQTIIDALRGMRARWVVDPVVRSSSGHPLSRLTPAQYLALAHFSVVLTPNADEAGWLLGVDRPRNWRQSAAAGQELVRRGFGAVVVKGGHLSGNEVVDVLCLPDSVVPLAGRRLRRAAVHRGTGCRFASTLAAGLALGQELPVAARFAKRAVARFLRPVPG